MQWLWRFLGIDQESLREVRLRQLHVKMAEAKTHAERMEYWRQICSERRAQVERPKG